MDMAEWQAAESMEPEISHLITEDDTPVDNLFSERQQKLLPMVLFDSWDQGKPFEAVANVGLFWTPSNDTVIVPDFLLSLGVNPRPASGLKKDQSYFVWVFGKPPDLTLEIVSNKKGGELDKKLEIYRRIGVAFYAVFDPFSFLGQRPLRLFKLVGGQYVESVDPFSMPELGLGFTFWEGSFFDIHARWLRFVDAEGKLLLFGKELADEQAEKTGIAEEQARIAQEAARAALEENQHLKEQAKAAALIHEALTAKLRELGVEPPL